MQTNTFLLIVAAIVIAYLVFTNQSNETLTPPPFRDIGTTGPFNPNARYQSAPPPFDDIGTTDPFNPGKFTGAAGPGSFVSNEREIFADDSGIGMLGLL